MSSSHPTGHSNPITIADLHEALADLLAAILAAHPDPVHATYPPDCASHRSARALR